MATVIKMQKFQCPCDDCSYCRNVFHQATRYLKAEEIRAHLRGKWTQAAIDEYLRRCATGEGRIQVGDVVIVRVGFAGLVDGTYTEVTAVDEEGRKLTVMVSGDCGEAITSFDNVALFVPEPEPPNRTSGRVRAASITLARVESPQQERVTLAVAAQVDVWKAADEQLRAWGLTLETEGSEHVAENVEFTIVWEDHTEYRGTYFLFHPDYEFNRGFTLADHIRDFCAWTSGRRVPQGAIETIFDREMSADQQMTLYYGSILDGYQLGSADQPITIWTGGDGFGGQVFFTRIGTRCYIEWYLSRDKGWRARTVEGLPSYATETGDAPAEVRGAIRKIHPEIERG